MILLDAYKALFFDNLLSFSTQDKVEELFCKAFRFTGCDEE
jgi:hypothetical protein